MNTLFGIQHRKQFSKILIQTLSRDNTLEKSRTQSVSNKPVHSNEFG